MSIALYWSNVEERQFFRKEIIQDTKDKIVVIRQRMAVAQSQQKSYVDNRRRALEFEVGDHVFLKISPMKGVMRFCKKGKLSPQFIGPFEIMQRIGKLAYRVALPPDLAGTHDLFHVSLLRKYIPNPDLIVEYEPLGLEEELTYKEKPVRILNRKDQVLCTKTIPIIKVLWRNHGVEEASWEAEEDMRNCYPHLFEDHVTYSLDS
jgi:hypothetical protein